MGFANGFENPFHLDGLFSPEWGDLISARGNADNAPG